MQRLKWLILVAIAASSLAMAAPAVSNHDPLHPDCSDGIDNDGDGFVDFPADRGCESATDQDEADSPPPPPPPAKAKCNSGRGNGSEPAPPVDCDPGNSGGKNNGGD